MISAPHRVFAYGSNMHLPDFRRWLRQNGHSPVGILASAAARLSGYRLVWNYRSRVRDGAAANVEPAAGKVVYGVVLTVSDETLAAVDQKEGHPGRYSRGHARIEVQLLDNGQSVPAWLYRVQPAWLVAEGVRPRRHYLSLMLEAAEAHGFAADYLAALRATPTCD